MGEAFKIGNYLSTTHNKRAKKKVNINDYSINETNTCTRKYH